MSDPVIHCLAYGSNLHPARMKDRVPSAKVVGIITMPDWKLAFHKRSTDLSGKCLFHETSNADDKVHGVLYSLASSDKSRLDDLEGLGKGYDERQFECSVGEASYRCFVYVAARTHIDRSLAPYHWYKDMVLLGARYHRFPDNYVAMIEAVPSLLDPKPQRAAEAEKVLAVMRMENAALTGATDAGPPRPAAQPS